MRNVATVGGALMGGPYLLRAAALKNNILFALIGTGGQGGSHARTCAQNGAVVCFADVDSTRWPQKNQPGMGDAIGYSDYRRMFDKHAKQIDAVIVATPDHHHYPAAMLAILLGKHVYVEKPMAWCVQEARLLTTAAIKMKVATQLGIQGHANAGSRRTLAYIKSGIIGDIKEIHTWTNRPIWPQGIDRPGGEDPVPATLDWDCWIGPAQMRPFKRTTYHPFNWRGWCDFGSGGFGDMGCHTWDVPYWAMMPDYPASLELLEINNATKESFPKAAHIKCEFPRKENRPAFTAHWYDGGLKPPAPAGVLNAPAPRGAGVVGMPATGSLYIGTKGTLLASGDYSDVPRLIPEALQLEMPQPPNILPPSIGHVPEWLAAVCGQAPIDSPGANFGYSGNLSECLSLGVILQKIGIVGFKIECDAVARTIKTPEAQALAKREYRRGWGVTTPYIV
jgi:hypothetical protein